MIKLKYYCRCMYVPWATSWSNWTQWDTRSKEKDNIWIVHNALSIKLQQRGMHAGANQLRHWLEPDTLTRPSQKYAHGVSTSCQPCNLLCEINWTDQTNWCDSTWYRALNFINFQDYSMRIQNNYRVSDSTYYSNYMHNWEIVYSRNIYQFIWLYGVNYAPYS